MEEERDMLRSVLERAAVPVEKTARLMLVLSEDKDIGETQLLEAFSEMGHALHDLGEGFLQYIKERNAIMQGIAEEAEKQSKLSRKDRRWLKQAGISFDDLYER